MRELKFRQWTTGWASGTNRMIYLGDIRDEDFSTLQVGELMQFTGITDKNGVEIYESDIVRINGLTFEVTINDFTQEWVIDGETGQERLGVAFKKCKVIGNIYENQEEASE